MSESVHISACVCYCVCVCTKIWPVSLCFPWKYNGPWYNIHEGRLVKVLPENTFASFINQRGINNVYEFGTCLVQVPISSLLYSGNTSIISSSAAFTPLTSFVKTDASTYLNKYVYLNEGLFMDPQYYWSARPFYFHSLAQFNRWVTLFFFYPFGISIPLSVISTGSFIMERIIQVVQ